MLAGIFLARYLPKQCATADDTDYGTDYRRRQYSRRHSSRRADSDIDRPGRREPAVHSTGDGGRRTLPSSSLKSLILSAHRVSLSKQPAARSLRSRSVLASDERYGIAALRTANALIDVEVLQPEPGSGSLYLGRDLTLLTRDNRYDCPGR